MTYLDRPEPVEPVLDLSYVLRMTYLLFNSDGVQTGSAISTTIVESRGFDSATELLVNAVRMHQRNGTVIHNAELREIGDPVASLIVSTDAREGGFPNG